MIILESAQVYSDRGPYFNPTDHPLELQEETAKSCGYCGDNLLEDEENYCKECQIMHDEYMRRTK